MLGKVGYACVNEHLKPRKFRSCRLKTLYSEGTDYLKELILHNIELTRDIILWNVDNRLYFYRLSSDLMPLVTHPDVLRDFPWRWYEDLEIKAALSEIRGLVRKNGLRLSMHPDQYTVLNSNRPEVVAASIDYLDYHARILEAIGGQDMVLHGGGVYGDKANAMKRFVKHYLPLDDRIKKYMRLENDDRSYDIYDILVLSEETDIPVILDVHHHRVLSDGPITKTLLDRIEATWGLKTPKIHISTGRDHPRDRAHHDYISLEDCRMINRLYAGRRVDVMVEAKKKEYAALGLKDYLDKGKINEIYRTH